MSKNKTKFIIGLSNPQETTFTNNNNQIIYNDHGILTKLTLKNKDTIISKNALAGSKINEIYIEETNETYTVNDYIYNDQVREICTILSTKNYSSIAEIANNYNTFSFSCKVKTQLPVEQQNSGSYGLILRVPYEMISPNGQEGASYLWASVSPNGTKVCYYYVSGGCYVADIDGSNPVFVGNIRAAKWLNDLTVVGMHDIDNGEYVTSSKLIAASIDGKVKQELTTDSSMAMYPSAEANRIAYSTPKGELFIINLK